MSSAALFVELVGIYGEGNPSTTTGSVGLPVVPFPACPQLLAPQHLTSVADVTAHVWVPPLVMSPAGGTLVYDVVDRAALAKSQRCVHASVVSALSDRMRPRSPRRRVDRTPGARQRYVLQRVSWTRRASPRPRARAPPRRSRRRATPVLPVRHRRAANRFPPSAGDVLCPSPARRRTPMLGETLSRRNRTELNAGALLADLADTGEPRRRPDFNE